MNNKVQIFREYLEVEDLAARELEDDDFNMFVFDADIKSGTSAHIVVFFMKYGNPDWLVKVEAFNYVKIHNDTKKEHILEKLNELNKNSVFEKYVLLDDGSIVVKLNYTFYDNFDPNQLLGSIFYLNDAINENYQGLMYVIWG